MAKKTGKTDLAKNAVVHAKVHLGEPEKIGGFGIAVDISVEGVEDDALIQAAHEVCLTQSSTCELELTSSQNCPYSRALTQGAVVNVSKA